MRNQTSLVRSGAVCGIALATYLAGLQPAAAEVTLAESDGWSFFTDGRINTFFSQGVGDDFPQPTPNPGMNETGGPNPQHTVVGSGQPFTAGFYSTQGSPSGKYFAQRFRSGFLGSVFGFGVKRNITETTTAKAYVGLWGTAHSLERDRAADFGRSTEKGFDVRYALVTFDGRWGSVTAGRQDGILGGISTEIAFLYGHNFGVGLLCLDKYYPACGHIGTGALGPGNGAGFVYATPSMAGLKLQVGLYDPVRLLGVWERVPYPRPEGRLTFERAFSPSIRMKLAAEGMYQAMSIRAEERNDAVWGVAAGGRFEAGPLRLGASWFQGKGLGAYVALQNAGSTFNSSTKEFRYFTGVYAQSALVFGREQISLGVGRTTDHQLPADKIDESTSGLKSQTGASICFYHRVADSLMLGIDYFRFQTDWWGAPNSTNNAAGEVVILPGTLTPEKQLIHFINAGATYLW